MTRVELETLAKRIDAVEAVVESMAAAQRKLFAKVDSIEHAGERREGLLQKVLQGQTDMMTMLTIAQRKDIKQDDHIAKVERLVKEAVGEQTATIKKESKQEAKMEGGKTGGIVVIVSAIVIEVLRQMGYIL